MKNKTYYKIKGFTIPELMIVVAVVAVLLVVGIPQMNKVVQGRQLVAQASEVASALAYARAEAAARAHHVVICGKNAAGTACSGSDDWSNGWIIFADKDNGSDLDAGEEIIKAEGAMKSGVTLEANTNLLAFNYLGESVAGVDVIFDLCSADPDNAGLDVNKSRKVAVNKVGSATISMGDATCN